MEINGLIGLLAEPRLAPRQTSRSKKSATTSASSVHNGSVTGGTSSRVWNVDATVEVRCGVLYEHSLSLQSRTGVRPQDIPAALVELVPFSFVAEWFVNIQEWIAAVTPKAGVNYLAEWTVTKTTIAHVVQTTVTKLGDNVSYRYIGGGTTLSSSYTSVETARRPSISIGLTHRFQEITFRKTLDFKRTADAFALLSRLIKA